jgi:hypothetical protein
VFTQGQTQGSTLQQRTNKTLATDPFKNTCKGEEVSPKVEAGGVVEIKCIQTSWDTDLQSQYLKNHLANKIHSSLTPLFTSQVKTLVIAKYSIIQDLITSNYSTHSMEVVDTERGVNQYQIEFKKKINLYLNHSIISNEQ